MKKLEFSACDWLRTLHETILVKPISNSRACKRQAYLQSQLHALPKFTVPCAVTSGRMYGVVESPWSRIVTQILKMRVITKVRDCAFDKALITSSRLCEMLFVDRSCVTSRKLCTRIDTHCFFLLAVRIVLEIQVTGRGLAELILADLNYVNCSYAKSKR